MTANELTKYTVKRMNLAGHFTWRQGNTPEGRKRHLIHKGVGDVMGISKNGKMLCFEVKVGKDKLSQAQKDFHSEIVKRGGIAVVISSESDVDFIAEHGVAQINLEYMKL